MNAEQMIREWMSIMARLGKTPCQPMPDSICHPVLHARVELDPKVARNVGLRGHKAQLRHTRYGD